MAKEQEGSKHQANSSSLLKSLIALHFSQLNGPLGVALSKKTNALYISDQNNNRIQRWYLGDSQGVTISGSTRGIPGTTPKTFTVLNNIALNANATRVYVSDRNNNRIQMFRLI